jgi:hypothetical protein
MCQFHSSRDLLQQAEGYYLLKGWKANNYCSLIYGLSAGLVCNKTAEIPCEVQTCNWKEGHTVGVNVEEKVETIVWWQNSETFSKLFQHSEADSRGGFWREGFAGG